MKNQSFTISQHRFKYLLALALAVMSLPLAAQQHPAVITGTVTDATTGMGLSRVNLRWKTSGLEAATDSAGRFSLPVPSAKDVLLVSYVGYETLKLTKEEVTAHSSLSIRLRHADISLQEITVSTGYQTLPRERATGSFSKVSAEDISRQTGPSLLSRLEGISNAVAFDKNSNRPPLTVRGLSSINGPKAPLIVLDNFPYEGDLDNINPEDVESVTVLKDAAAASIWGSRAGNGVIVITTRKGKLNQPLHLSFSSLLTQTAAPDLSYAKPMSSSDYIDAERQLFDHDLFSSRENSYLKPALSPVAELLIAERDGQLSAEAANEQINALRNRDVRDELRSQLYGKGFDQQYNFSLSGGAPGMTYRFSAGYDRNRSTLDATYRKTNLSASGTFRPLKALELDASLYYTQSNQRSGKPEYNGNYLGDRLIYPYSSLAPGIDVYRRTWTDTVGGGSMLDWKYYPLDDYRHNYTQTRLQEMTASIAAQLHLLKGLKATAAYQYERQNTNASTLQDISSFAARDMVNRFTVVEPSGNLIHNVPMGGILSPKNSTLASYTVRGQLSYELNAGDHQLNAIAGAEARQRSTGSSAYRLYGYNDELLTYGQTDFVNWYPDQVTGYDDRIPDGIFVSEGLNRYTSLYANAAYTYRHRYTLSASARKDASNLFGLKTNEKGVPLWSAGAAWNLSRESFYTSSLLPYLNLRATYGVSGNVDNSKSAVTTILITGPATFTGLQQASVIQYPNPELRWERVKMLNIGLDYRLKDNVISGSLEYYRKRAVDLFGPAENDYTNGLSTLTKNVASMSGQGIDLALQSRSFDRTFKWYQTLNLNYNTDKITDYYLSTTQGSAYLTGGTTISPLTGQPVYAIRAYRWGGLDGQTGDPMGYVDGELSKDYTAIRGTATTVDDLVYGGRALPAYFGNFLNTFRYKRFTLSLNLSYKFGYSFIRNSINYADLMSNGAGHADYEKRWQQPGDEQFTTVPSLIFDADNGRDSFYSSSEVLITSGSHVRLDFAGLSYDLDESLLRRLSLASLRLFLNAADAGILWRANPYGIDPDYPGTLPPSLSFTAGLRAGF